MANTSQKKLLRGNSRELYRLQRWFLACTVAMVVFQLLFSGLASLVWAWQGMLGVTSIHLGALVLLYKRTQLKPAEPGWALAGDSVPVLADILRDTCYLFGTIQVTTRVLDLAWYLLLIWPLLACADLYMGMSKPLKLIWGLFKR